MRNILKFAFVAALAVSLQAAPDWLTNFDEAKAKAEKEGKALLLDFTGSDWCPPCKALKKKVFDEKEFQTFAEKNLVLVEVDFPNRKKLPKEQQKANDALSDKFRIQAYPTIVIADKTGKELGRLEGYENQSPADYIKKLETLMARGK